MRTFYLIAALFCILPLVADAQLTGMSPSQGSQNQVLQTTITSNGLFIQAGSPSGNLYEVKLVNGSNVLYMFDYFNSWMLNAMVIDPNTAEIEFQIPFGATPGLYDLQVTTCDIWNPWWGHQYYTLPGAFTVLPPDGYITGNIFHDLNKNGVKDAGEPGMGNHPVKLLPTNTIIYSDASGNYSFPVLNGIYSVVILPNSSQYMFGTNADTIPVTISNSNSPGNNFGRIHALTSVTPNFGYKGMMRTHQFVSDKPIFRPGIYPYGNVSQFRVLSSPGFSILSSNITVIDSFTVNVNISIPAGTAAANNLDVYCYINSGNSGYHYLKQSFSIITPPAWVSGTMFFDQNQNKILDAGEPKINNAKVFLTPDSSIAFSNQAGEYLLGSTGGQQVLSYGNNISGLSLFTDSVTYTFNATGNISGKNFGFISTFPDYSLNIKDLYLFARCNSQQYTQLTIRNISNVTYNTRVWIKHHNSASFVSASIPPSLISNDTIYWDINNLAPYTEVILYAKFTLPGAGNTVSLTGGAHSLDGSGVIQQTRTLQRHYSVFCAWDPNDKQVTPEGWFSDHLTSMYDTLDYLIRFQNTGNDTAFNVVIVDTLDKDLNIDTYEIVSNSHSMKTEIEKNGLVTYTMNNIMLPDSNVNEPASHGYIRYRIQAKSGLPDSTLIFNTAYIYFDFNPAVVTNTTFNTMVYGLGNGPLPINLIDFSAKPTAETILIKWRTASELNNDYYTVEKSLDGIYFIPLGVIQGAGTTSNANAYTLIDRNPVEGLQYYRLTQTDYDGDSQTFGPVAVMWSSDQEFLVYPNPSKGELFANIPKDCANKQGRLTISNSDGKQVYVKKMSFSTEIFGIPLLQPGYYLRAGSYIVNIDFNGKSFSQIILVK